MKLDADKIWDEANLIYAAEKLTKAGYTDFSYLAPEMIPQIESFQVRAMLFALVNAINTQTETK
jgi:hypothetical protein